MAKNNKNQPGTDEMMQQPPYENRNIITTRIFDTPVAQMYKAWSNAAIIARWWGPKGFTNTIHKFEFVPGGTWTLTMHDSNNRPYDNQWTFEEIAAEERLIIDHTSEPKFKAIVTFENIDTNKTRLTYRMQFATAQQCEAVKAYAPAANEQKFDKLEDILEKI